MILKCGESRDDRSVDAKRRHLIGDALFGLWDTSKNHESKVLKRRPLGVRNTFKVRINLGRAHERDSMSTFDVSIGDCSDHSDVITTRRRQRNYSARVPAGPPTVSPVDRFRL